MTNYNCESVITTSTWREDNIRTDLMEQVRKVWTGFFWLRIGTSSELL
jgi:hypothetical protein